MNEENKIINGWDFTSIYTLKSWYDQDSIEMMTFDKKHYRIKVSELQKIFDQLRFKIDKSPETDKRYRHTYLVIDDEWFNNLMKYGEIIFNDLDGDFL